MVGADALAAIPLTVPDHAYFPLYGPDFRMATREKTLPDKNDEVFLDRCVLLYIYRCILRVCSGRELCRRSCAHKCGRAQVKKWLFCLVANNSQNLSSTNQQRD